jgi:hypothetical protein
MRANPDALCAARFALCAVIHVFVESLILAQDER